MKNKTIEAMLRGYIIFDVNGRRFWTYEAALNYKKTIEGGYCFMGLNVFKGWRAFSIHYVPREPVTLMNFSSDL